MPEEQLNPGETKKAPRSKIVVIAAFAAAVIFFLVLFIGLRVLTRKDPTPDEMRVQHITYITKLLEAYKSRNGVYPQPTVRSETIRGVNHVWGYEANKAALASCTVVLEDNQPNSEESRCGGNVYDAEGNIIGWKGTLTVDSALNTVEIAHKGEGRPDAPLTTLAQSIPIDPVYAVQKTATGAGFGEYVYAVRMPKDGAQGKGGIEYQVAVTLPDYANSSSKTYIFGDYFVTPEERELLPSSLIGPGILFDAFANPKEGQESALHVLRSGQKQGFPNPFFGDGEETLQLLSLTNRAETLQRAIADRVQVLQGLPQSDAVTAFADTLTQLYKQISAVQTDLPAAEDLAAPEQNIAEIASALSKAAEAFITEKDQEVQDLLILETQHRQEVQGILQSITETVKKAHESVLFARDEILKYLDGEGIEEQSRQRAGRKLEAIIDTLPHVQELFEESALTFPMAFLMKEEQEMIFSLQGKKIPEESEGDILLSTVIAELALHMSDLRILLNQMIEDLENVSIPIDDVDESLRKFARALSSENDRINTLLENIANANTAEKLRSDYEGREDLVQAIADVAQRTSRYGDYSPLLFTATMLNALMVDERPGIPDFDLYDNQTEAHYQGVPYPLMNTSQDTPDE